MEKNLHPEELKQIILNNIKAIRRFYRSMDIIMKSGIQEDMIIAQAIYNIIQRYRDINIHEDEIDDPVLIENLISDLAAPEIKWCLRELNMETLVHAVSNSYEDYKTYWDQQIAYQTTGLPGATSPEG